MTAIIGYADTLLTVRLSKERQERALTYIGNECRRLSRLSVKMLELTGLYETGESQLILLKASPGNTPMLLLGKNSLANMKDSNGHQISKKQQEKYLQMGEKLSIAYSHFPGKSPVPGREHSIIHYKCTFENKRQGKSGKCKAALPINEIFLERIGINAFKCYTIKKIIRN